MKTYKTKEEMLKCLKVKTDDFHFFIKDHFKYYYSDPDNSFNFIESYISAYYLNPNKLIGKYVCANCEEDNHVYSFMEIFKLLFGIDIKEKDLFDDQFYLDLSEKLMIKSRTMLKSVFLSSAISYYFTMKDYKKVAALFEYVLKNQRVLYNFSQIVETEISETFIKMKLNLIAAAVDKKLGNQDKSFLRNFENLYGKLPISDQDKFLSDRYFLKLKKSLKDSKIKRSMSTTSKVTLSHMIFREDIFTEDSLNSPTVFNTFLNDGKYFTSNIKEKFGDNFDEIFLKYGRGYLISEHSNNHRKIKLIADLKRMKSFLEAMDSNISLFDIVEGLPDKFKILALQTELENS